VLDLFAGTGSVGLEALSRGAARVVFVEQHRGTARVVSRNCEALGVDREVGRLMVRPAIKAVGELGRSGEQFDIVWADPPFEAWQDGLDALNVAATAGIVRVHGLCCLECPDRAEVPSDIAPLKRWRSLEGGASRLVIMTVEGKGE
jgi:16S rRNA (guanine966-N2)-methyltransferase